MTAHRGSVTIADVARSAGVSPATVSRVMNGRFGGEPEVAERVREAARELEYAPSPLARSLALGRTHAIAFVVPDLANPAFQSVLAGLSKTAALDGYRVLVADSGETPSEEGPLSVEIRRRTDAIVLCAPRMPEEELAALAAQLHPLVLINRSVPQIAAPSLAIDYRAGIAALAQHLHDLGHRSLAYVYGPERSASNAHRERGLDDFVREHPDVQLERIPAGAGSEEGRAAAPAVRETGATAALAFNDLVAIGLIGGLREFGMRVPEDISVTGFDDIPLAQYVAPALTTASVSHSELGVLAWQRMRALMNGEQPGHNVVFQPRVEVRDSSGPAPAGHGD
ncbi:MULTISPECIES: LacI family DNA-binding transcriptional regulator [Microbacterium]|uniref:LacI family DNA-binding transcriptional regulator n=1 Tax=Microbacterium TaxID=33882 RepID=UPI00051A8315|nr:MULTISPECIES: LacI family DNA-binding transcriptional regulator [Microbacterium]MCE7481337.1 LacI family transcriptional regulator [Microbacterium profundi]